MRVVQEPFHWGHGVEIIEETLWDWLNNTQNITTVFDIGAKNSIMPRYFPTSSIYMFEPLPNFAKELHDQFESNPKVTLCPYGVGDKDKPLTFYTNTESFIERKLHVQSRDPIYLPVKSFTSVMNEFGLEDTGVDFVKIDTEGYEYTILKNAKKYIDNKKIRFIQFEVGGCLFDTKETLYDIFALFDDSWRIYNMQSPGILNRLPSAFTWDPSDWGYGNFLATYVPLN
jgi:FkbM family methyltransferase